MSMSRSSRSIKLCMQYVTSFWFGQYGDETHCICLCITVCVGFFSDIAWFLCSTWVVLNINVRQSGGGVECQQCVSFVFIVLTGAQWYDCVAIWNPTPTQSFRGSEVGEMCAPLAWWTMHFERARKPRVIHPAYHQNHSASPTYSDSTSAHLEFSQNIQIKKTKQHIYLYR